MSNVEWPQDRVFPVFSKPDSLVVVDLRSMDFFRDYKHLLLITLQGLVNRERPKMYVILTNRDLVWLNVIRSTGIEIHNVGLKDAIETFAGYANGCIVYDPNVPDTVNVASTMSGIYNAVVVHPNDIAWAEEHGLRIVNDLRGKFRRKIEIYEWAYKELWPRCSHRLLVPMKPVHTFAPPRPMQIAVRDYVVALKLLAHYLDPRDPKERRLFCKLLEEMPKNSAVLGWYEGTEHITVRLASEHGKFVVVVTGNPYLVSNLTVWSGIRAEVKFKLPPIDFSKLGLDKVYVTFYMNDGDNVQWNIMMRNFWEDPYRGKVPVAWTISPFLVDLAPLVMKYYVETMSELDAFVSGPSGAGYWYPNVNPEYTDEFLGLTNEYFKRSGLMFTEVLGEFLDGETLPKYAKELRVLAIKIGYRGMDTFPYYTSESPVPIIPGTIEFSEGEEEKAYSWLRAIATVYKRRPLHVLAICVPWEFKSLKSLRLLADMISSDKELMLVNFHEFVIMLNPEYGTKLAEELLKRAKGAGVSKRTLLEVEDCLRVAKKYCEEGRWREASLEANKALRILASSLKLISKED